MRWIISGYPLKSDVALSDFGDVIYYNKVKYYVRVVHCCFIYAVAMGQLRGIAIFGSHERFS